VQVPGGPIAVRARVSGIEYDDQQPLLIPEMERTGLASEVERCLVHHICIAEQHKAHAIWPQR
jgi:hypothetical protein